MATGLLGDAGGDPGEPDEDGAVRAARRASPEFRDLVVPGTTPAPAVGLGPVPRLTATTDADESPTPPTGPAAPTVDDITEFEHKPLDPDELHPTSRRYTVDALPPAKGRWVAWLLLAGAVAVVTAAGVGLAMLVK